jgi:hypothetical protein
MRWRILLACAAVGGMALTAWAGDPAVRTLDLKGLNLGKAEGKVSEPKVITSNDELAKAVTDEEALAALKKQVDFGKEKLLLFAWSGSGGDKIATSLGKGDKGAVVTVTYTPGLTRDLRMHHQVLAIPKDATWKFESAR